MLFVFDLSYDLEKNLLKYSMKRDVYDIDRARAKKGHKNCL